MLFGTAASAEEKYVTASDGVRLYLKIAGKGSPLLFIHGGPGQGITSFEQMRGNALEQYFKVVYLDQRGSGRSAGAEDYSLARMIKDIEEVRNDLGFTKWAVLAHSFGGVIAVNYAKQHPKRVSHLVMSNATLHFYDSENIKERIRFAGKLLNKEFPFDGKTTREELLKVWLQARQELNRTDISYKLFTENVETIQTMIKADAYPGRNIAFGTAVMNDPAKFREYYANYSNLSASIKAPVLVLTGTTDYAVGPNVHRTFKFPKMTVVTIPGGHMPYYDNSSLFVESIKEFIASR